MNARKLLTSLAVTIMLTNMLLVLLAFAPATITNVFSGHAAQPAIAAQAYAPGVLVAGGAPGGSLGEPKPAFWGRAWACVKCGGNHVLKLWGAYEGDPNIGKSCRKCRGDKTT